MSYNTPSKENSSNVLGKNSLSIESGDDIQIAIDAISDLGGGDVNLEFGTYNLVDDITLPDDVTMNCNGATIDFGGGAYGILIEGSSAYSTGTVAISFGDDSVIGTGTVWTNAMVGQSILLGDYWYEIIARISDTEITIGSDFIGTDLSGDTYVIATTVSNVHINNLTVQNSSASLIKGRYADGVFLNYVNSDDGDIGFDFQDCANINFPAFSASNCTTWGVKWKNVPFGTLQNFGIISGGGMYLERVSNTSMGICSWQAIVGVALSFKNCYNLGMLNYAIIQSTSHGIEFISGNNDIDVNAGYIRKAGGDGIKLTATSDKISIGDNSILETTGKQINIANANCDNNIIIGNNLDGGGTGAVTNSGTGTLIRSNKGVADN